jgi:hypothetical protein
VPDPVRADALDRHPGQMSADAGPQVVIAPVGDRPSAGVPQQLRAGRGVALFGVLAQAGHQGGRDRLPAECPALFPQQDQALLRVEVLRAQGQSTATPAGSFSVQPQQQRVQLRVITRLPLTVPVRAVGNTSR